MSYLFLVTDTLSDILSFCSPVELYNLRRTCTFLRDFIRATCYKWENGVRLINGKHWGKYKDTHETWITDTFTIHYYVSAVYEIGSLLTEYLQGNLKIQYRENKFKEEIKCWKENIIIYTEFIQSGIRDVSYLIDGAYTLDRYLHIFDKLAIISTDYERVAVYSAINGLLFIVNPELELVDIIFCKLKPKAKTSEEKLKEKILKVVYKTDSGFSFGGLEGLLKNKPFINYL